MSIATKTLLWLVLPLVCSAGACTGPPAAAGNDAEERPSPPDGSSPVGPLLPLQLRHGIVEITDHNGKFHRAGFSLEPHLGHWRETIEGWRISELRREADGTVVVTRDSEIRENVRAEYEPPMVLLPATLALEETVEHVCDIRIVDLAAGHQIDQGQCRYSIRLQPGHQAGGHSSVQVVRTERHIQLGLASAKVLTDVVYAPGQGWIQQDTGRITTALGLFTTTKHQLMRLVESRPP